MKRLLGILPYAAGVIVAIILMHDVVRFGESLNSQD
jgi:hypothetical protein